MFGQFEGNERERKAKQEERLRLLKNLHESGYFDEKGTEEVTVKAAGINPCDLGHVTFTGEAPEPMSPARAHVAWPCSNPNCASCHPKPGEGTPYEQWQRWQRPVDVSKYQEPKMLRHDHDGSPPMENMCRKCGGHGDLVTYGNELERCTQCGGTGRADTHACGGCAGRGYDDDDQVCFSCDGRGIEGTP